MTTQRAERRLSTRVETGTCATIEATGRTYDDLSKIMWVAGHVEVCKRLQNLSWSHHMEVAKFEPKVQAWLDARDDAKVWIIRNQFARRNLTNFQRAELALQLEPLIAAKAKERMAAGVKANPEQNSAQGKTRAELAKIDRRNEARRDGDHFLRFQTNGRAVVSCEFRSSDRPNPKTAQCRMNKPERI